VTELTWRPPAFAGRAGAAWRDITPPLGILARNWGAADRDTAAGVHRVLLVTALAVGGDDGPARYLVSADLGWWRNAADEWSVRSRVLDALGCAEEDLLIHLVHTHSGPTLSTAYPDLPGGELVGPYLETLSTSIVAACRQAAAESTQVTATFATGRCGVAVHRDLRVGGREVVAFDPGTPADDTLLVGRFADLGGRAVATLVNYACHPTTLGWQPPMLSPDWIGRCRELVSNHTGAPCLVLQGASGELSPREQYGDRFLTDRVGSAVGHAALSTLESLPPPGSDLRMTDVVESGATLGRWQPVDARPSSRLDTRLLTVPLPARPALTEDELRTRFAGLAPAAAEERVRRALALRSGYVEDGVARHPVWVWRLGDAVVVAQPGEAYSWLQTELRRRRPDLSIFVVNCANGPGFVYLPPASTYARDVYQVWQTEVLPGGLELVADAVSGALA
jgi:hypothetical protein